MNENMSKMVTENTEVNDKVIEMATKSANHAGATIAGIIIGTVALCATGYLIYRRNKMRNSDWKTVDAEINVDDTEDVGTDENNKEEVDN